MWEVCGRRGPMTRTPVASRHGMGDSAPPQREPSTGRSTGVARSRVLSVSRSLESTPPIERGRDGPPGARLTRQTTARLPAWLSGRAEIHSPRREQTYEHSPHPAHYQPPQMAPPFPTRKTRVQKCVQNPWQHVCTCPRARRSRHSWLLCVVPGEGRHQTPSDAIRRHQTQSDAIRRNRLAPRGRTRWDFG